MIVEKLLTALRVLFDALTRDIDIPFLPAEVSEYIDQALEYIVAGVGVFANYCHIEYIMALFGIIISIDVGIAIYHLVMWVLKKIPILNIK